MDIQIRFLKLQSNFNFHMCIHTALQSVSTPNSANISSSILLLRICSFLGATNPTLLLTIFFMQTLSCITITRIIFYTKKSSWKFIFLPAMIYSLSLAPQSQHPLSSKEWPCPPGKKGPSISWPKPQFFNPSPSFPVTRGCGRPRLGPSSFCFLLVISKNKNYLVCKKNLVLRAGF